MTEQKKRKRWPIVLLGLIGLCVVLAIFASLGGDGTDTSSTTGSTPRDTATPKPGATPKPTATPRPLAPSFKEIQTSVEAMTEAQWKPYLDSLEGQQVQSWTGWIVDVDEKSGEAYEAWIDMDDPGMFTTQDVYVPVDKETAMLLGKDKQVTFSGVIESASEFLGDVTIHLEEAVIAAP